MLAGRSPGTAMLRSHGWRRDQAGTHHFGEVLPGMPPDCAEGWVA
jgi:hypothetical protein